MPAINVRRIALDLQRVLIVLERLIQVAACLVEHAAIEQDVAEIFLHPDLAQNLQRLIEIGQSGIGLADGDLIRRQFREVGRQQALHTILRVISIESWMLLMASSGLFIRR